MKVEKDRTTYLDFLAEHKKWNWVSWENPICKETWNSNPWGWATRKTLPRRKGHMLSTRTKSREITLDLESLGSSVSGMNLTLHRKNTHRTLNDLHSK